MALPMVEDFDSNFDAHGMILFAAALFRTMMMTREQRTWCLPLVMPASSAPFALIPG